MYPLHISYFSSPVYPCLTSGRLKVKKLLYLFPLYLKVIGLSVQAISGK